MRDIKRKVVFGIQREESRRERMRKGLEEAQIEVKEEEEEEEEETSK